MENPDSVIFFGKQVAQLSGSVRRTVIHQQDLKIFPGLGADAVDASLQAVQDIVGRHDHADQRLLGYTTVHCFILHPMFPHYSSSVRKVSARQRAVHPPTPAAFRLSSLHKIPGSAAPHILHSIFL